MSHLKVYLPSGGPDIAIHYTYSIHIIHTYESGRKTFEIVPSNNFVYPFFQQWQQDVKFKDISVLKTKYGTVYKSLLSFSPLLVPLVFLFPACLPPSVSTSSSLSILQVFLLSSSIPASLCPYLSSSNPPHPHLFALWICSLTLLRRHLHIFSFSLVLPKLTACNKIMM